MAERPEDGEAAVRCEDVHVSLGGRPVLTALTLSARRGEVFGLVGANGGAKTTTLRLMAGILKPGRGRVSVFGASPASMRHRIGVMGQGLSLHQDLTVSENLAARARLFGLPDARRIAAAAIERFGLAPYARARVAALSGGWQRRAQFAAALIHDPDLLLLDEPTVGLDTAARAEIWRHVLLQAASGAAVVVSTHDLSEAERFSRLIFLVAGAVRASGTVADVLAASGARAYLLHGRDAPAAATEALASPGIVTAYPGAGALRVVVRQDGAAAAEALAARLGLRAEPSHVGLDDAAQALLLPP